MDYEIDVDEALQGGSERQLFLVWDIPSERRMWQGAREHARQGGNAEHEQAAENALGELPDVSALQALSANKRLVELLTGRRWFVMQQAREEGASWSEIGEALGMSKQAAHDWYRRKIEHQEKYAPDFHDAARARAVLDEPHVSAATVDE